MGILDWAKDVTTDVADEHREEVDIVEILLGMQVYVMEEV